MTPFVCSGFLETCRDSNRCHLCLQPKKAHVLKEEAPYWYRWLRDQVLLELNT